MRRHFLKVFIPTALLGLLVTSLIYRAHYTSVKQEIISESELATEKYASQLGSRSLSIGRGLNRLATLNASESELDLDQLERDLFGFINSRTEVVQARFINQQGFEVIRYNRDSTFIFRTPEEELQDKSGRSYVYEHLNDAQGSISYTTIELNKEHGKIQVPYTLVARWMVPLFDNSGHRYGLLVANVDVSFLLQENARQHHNPNQHFIFTSGDSLAYYKGQVLIGDRSRALLDSLDILNFQSQEHQITSAGLVLDDQFEGFQQIVEEHLRIGDPHVQINHDSELQVLSFIPLDVFISKVHANIPYILTLQSFILIVIAFFSHKWARFRRMEQFNMEEALRSNKALKASQDALRDAKSQLENLVQDQSNKLNENQQLLTALFDSSVHYAGIIDTAGTLIDVNRMTLNTLGIPKKYIIGKKIWDFEVFGDREKVKSRLEMAIKSAINGDKVAYESTMKDHEGGIRRVGFSLSPIRSKDGSVNYLIPEGVDITELHEKDRQLHEVLDQMSTRNKQLKEFSHIISHNVRSPIGNLGLLLSILDDAENDEERDEIISKLREVNASLQNLLEELLETVKILDNAEIKPENIALLPAIEQAQNLLARQIDESGATINIEIKKSREVFFPKLYLNSLFLNLMSNAIKYRSEERNLIIDIACHADDKGNPVVTFTDNGSGIDLKKNGHKVFGLYKTFDRKRPGKGLGLFMTKTQIESSGGKIQISSKINEGTTFSVTFPTLKKENLTSLES